MAAEKRKGSKLEQTLSSDEAEVITNLREKQHFVLLKRHPKSKKNAFCVPLVSVTEKTAGQILYNWFAMVNLVKYELAKRQIKEMSGITQIGSGENGD